MELFEIASVLENLCAQVNKVHDLITICEEGLAECADFLRDGDGMAKYAAGQIDRYLTLVEVVSTGIGAAAMDLRAEADRVYKVHWATKPEANGEQNESK